MSSFYCEKCGTAIIDSPNGYITGCEHYPTALQAENKRLREVIKDIKFEAEFNGNDESVQKIFGLAKQALGE